MLCQKFIVWQKLTWGKSWYCRFPIVSWISSVSHIFRQICTTQRWWYDNLSFLVPNHLLVATGPSRLETQVRDLEILRFLLSCCYSGIFQKDLHIDSFKTRTQGFLTLRVQRWNARAPASMVWVHFAMPGVSVDLPWSQDLTRDINLIISVYFSGIAVLVNFISRNSRNVQ